MNSLSGVRIGTRNQDKKNREKKKNKDSIVLGTPSSIPHKQNPETLPNGPVDWSKAVFGMEALVSECQF